MNLSEYFQRLQAKLSAVPSDDESVLALLYEVFSENNAMYDDKIKSDFHALYEAMNGIPLREIDRIVYPVCTLCRDHQKSGFMEGVRVGFQLSTEISGENHLKLRIE